MSDRSPIIGSSERYPSLAIAVDPKDAEFGDMVWGREGRPPNVMTGRLRRVSPASRNGEQVGWRVIVVGLDGQEYAPWIVPLSARLMVTVK